MIRVSDEAKRLLGTLWTPQREVLRLILRSSEADGAGRLAFRHGRGEGADQIVQHGGLQVLRIDRSVRRGSFDDSIVEVVDGTLGVVPPGPGPQTTALAAPFTGRSGTRNVTSSTRAREGGDRREARGVRGAGGQAARGRG